MRSKGFRGDGGSSNSNKRKENGLGESVRKRQTVVGMEVFDCAVCSNPLRPPIFESSNGSFICSRCRDELPESERAATQRCSSMERVVGNIFVPCKHGCSTMIAYNRKDEHERECPVRPCVCPVSGCGFVAPTVVLLDHLTTLHKFPTTPIKLFDMFSFTIKPGSQVLSSEQGRLFLLDVVSLESFGHAVSLVCVRPKTPRATVDVFVEFSCFEGHIQASKIEIRPDGESSQCLCVVPDEEDEETDVAVNIRICMVYYDNEELQEKEKENDHMFDYDFDEEED